MELRFQFVSQCFASNAKKVSKNMEEELTFSLVFK